MRKVTGLVSLVGALIAPLSLAQAAEVTHLYTNNQFANAVSTDPTTGVTIGIFVTRLKGKGEPVDSIFAIASGPAGSAFVSGTLPHGAFHADAKSASLDVNIADIALTSSEGFPADGVITVDWAATDVTRTSGSTKFEFGDTTVNIVGTSTSATADVSGTFFGVDLIAPAGDLSRAHDSVIIHVASP